MPLARRTRLILKWAGAVVGILIVGVLLTLAFMDWNALKGPIERFASARSGRTVEIAGNLDVHIWSLTPQVTVEGITLGNPPWEAKRPMARIEKVHAELKLLPLLVGDVILPRVQIIHPQIYLHRDTSGRANWTFENKRPTNAPAGPPPQLPVVRDFLIDDGKVDIRDDILKLVVRGTVVAREKGTHENAQAFRIEGKGTLNAKPFAATVTGGPLINLDPDRPYPFDLHITAGDIRVRADGRVQKPFDLGRLTLNVETSGQDLADAYYLTQLALPNTPPFKLSASIERNEAKIRVPKLQGSVGQSDLHGSLFIDISRKRPVLSGELESKQLRLADLAAPLGSKAQNQASLAQTAEHAKPSKKGAEQAPPAPNRRLFPTARLQVDRVRAMDADVKFTAHSIKAGSLPVKEVAFHVKLDEGVLSLEPFAFELPQGKLTGTVRIDARGKTPATKLDVRARDIQLDQLKGKAPDAKPPLGGVMQARAVVSGRGDSVHDFFADADGRLTAVLPDGRVNAAFAELTGINVTRGLGLLLTGNDESTQIRCGVAQFDIERGTMRAQNIVFDTTDVKITGRGDIELGPEDLDLSIKGEPKKLRLTRLRTPIEINGKIMKPKIGVDVGKTVKQGAIATALGAALTPFAAIIAFVDPGLAKDENCAALLSTAQPATKTATKPNAKGAVNR
jgi:uncharacterized protein involved in outer membrane biogenesis